MAYFIEGCWFLVKVVNGQTYDKCGLDEDQPLLLGARNSNL